MNKQHRQPRSGPTWITFLQSLDLRELGTAAQQIKHDRQPAQIYRDAAEDEPGMIYDLALSALEARAWALGRTAG